MKNVRNPKAVLLALVPLGMIPGAASIIGDFPPAARGELWSEFWLASLAGVIIGASALAYSRISARSAHDDHLGKGKWGLRFGVAMGAVGGLLRVVLSSEALLLFLGFACGFTLTGFLYFGLVFQPGIGTSEKRR